MRTITIAATLALMAASAPASADSWYRGRYFDASEGSVLRQGAPGYGYGWQYWYGGQYFGWAEGPVLRQGAPGYWMWPCVRGSWHRRRC
jgi:hypothetical protein